MTVGTRSVLFGVHNIFVHPITVGIAWWKLYGPPFDPRLWIAFLVHDLGYLGKSSVEGPIGETHVELGARIMQALSGASWGEFCRRHSRYYARSRGLPISRLCVADKLAFVLTPAWLYLPMARASGELTEYMERSKERQAGNEYFTPAESAQLESNDPREWLNGLQSYTYRWVLKTAARMATDGTGTPRPGNRLIQALDDPATPCLLAPLDRLVADALEFVSRGEVPDLPDRIVTATTVALRASHQSGRKDSRVADSNDLIEPRSPTPCSELGIWKCVRPWPRSRYKSG